MKQHYKKREHGGVKYFCDKCDFTTTILSSLNRHKKTENGGNKYPCDQCDFSATSLLRLVSHKVSNHEGVKYQCDKCEYVAIQNSDLMKHKESKHEDAYRHRRSKHSVDKSFEINVKNDSVLPWRQTDSALPGKVEKSNYQVSENKPQLLEPVFIESSHMCDGDTEIKQEDNINDPLSLIKTEPVENVIFENDPGISDVSSVKQEVDMRDAEFEN